MDRSLHDALCVVKRVLESGEVVPGESVCGVREDRGIEGCCVGVWVCGCVGVTCANRVSAVSVGGLLPPLQLQQPRRNRVSHRHSPHMHPVTVVTDASHPGHLLTPPPLTCPGGGAVEAALSVYLEGFATSLGSREQLAIAEFAEALLVLPKTLAVNAAKVCYMC
jgi:TCP-1/cpn60 chaperonin family